MIRAIKEYILLEHAGLPEPVCLRVDQCPFGLLLDPCRLLPTSNQTWQFASDHCFLVVAGSSREMVRDYGKAVRPMRGVPIVETDRSLIRIRLGCTAVLRLSHWTCVGKFD